MNQEEFNQLENYTKKVLKELPPLAAPGNLIPTVLEIIAQRARPIGFWAWALPLRFGLISASIFIAIGSALALAWVPAKAETIFAATEVSALLSAFSSILNAFWITAQWGFSKLISFSSNPLAWMAAGSFIGIYLLLIASTATLLQIRKYSQQSL